MGEVAGVEKGLLLPPLRLGLCREWLRLLESEAGSEREEFDAAEELKVGDGWCSCSRREADEGDEVEVEMGELKAVEELRVVVVVGLVAADNGWW